MLLDFYVFFFYMRGDILAVSGSRWAQWTVVEARSVRGNAQMSGWVKVGYNLEATTQGFSKMH